ncbi:Alpha/Beta hydrolase protein [Aspergillus pseudoustus]|uniref:Alpha/Beta hydrolase protein n=1 Tax=Aspergillus pseudoustus TaxID=1810923 RepID=A0ABR4JJX6_9EURO
MSPPTSLPEMSRPPYDPELQPKLNGIDSSIFRSVEAIRAVSNAFSLDTALAGLPHMEHTEHVVKTLEGPVELSVFTNKGSTSTSRPAVYIVHGGGQISGTRFSAVDAIIRWFDGIDIVAVCVEYRVAPEHPAPAALNDSYAGLVWVFDNAVKLGIDPARIMVMGGSGGGPIAAGCALLARENQRPKLLAQMLVCPMLDDRGETASAQQFKDCGPWSGTTNQMAWDCVLGRERPSHVDHLVVPARATDLKGLPQTFIDVGEAEVFRDEAVAYASLLWKCGVSTELHVWRGAFHGTLHSPALCKSTVVD